MANQVLYGFMNLQDIFAQRVSDGSNIQTVTRAIEATVAEHNRQMDAIMKLFVKPTDEHQIRYRTSGTARLQPLDDNGRARPIKFGGHYDVAFPLGAGGAAWGANYRTREKLTVGEANELTGTLISADVRWMRDHVLAAMFAATSWTFSDEEFGDLTIKGPANGDTDQYLIINGADAGATDDHILAQAAAIADATNPFPTIHDELTEHPENGGDVIVFVPTSNKAATEGLTNFYPIRDPNLRSGSGVTELLNVPNLALPGKIFGYVDECYVAEWKALPADHLIGVTTQGEPPLGMREEPESSLRGFKRVAERNDHPFLESQYLRIAGFGSWNRVGVVSYQVGNATYAVPTGYESPMP